MSALVSVVIPIYNAERFLGATLQSVLQQTYPSTEIICVDDGSRDGTGEILRQVASDHANVTVVSQRNAGVAAARNRGIAVARGQLVSFIDADDLWHPQKLAHEVAALERSGSEFGVAYSLFRQIDQADRVVGRSRRDPLWQGDVSRVLLIENIVGNCSAFTVRRSFLDRTPGFDDTLRARDAEGCEDWKLLCQLAAICKFVAVPLYLVGYRRHPATMSRNVRSMKRSADLIFEDLQRDGLVVPRDVTRARRGLQEFQRLRASILERKLSAHHVVTFFLTLQSRRSAWRLVRWISNTVFRMIRRATPLRKRNVRFQEMSPDP